MLTIKTKITTVAVNQVHKNTVINYKSIQMCKENIHKFTPGININAPLEQTHMYPWIIYTCGPGNSIAEKLDSTLILIT